MIPSTPTSSDASSSRGDSAPPRQSSTCATCRQLVGTGLENEMVSACCPNYNTIPVPGPSSSTSQVHSHLDLSVAKRYPTPTPSRGDSASVNGDEMSLAFFEFEDLQDRFADKSSRQPCGQNSTRITMTTEERRRQLEDCPLVGRFVTNKAECIGCGQFIAMDGRNKCEYYIGLLAKHFSTCKGCPDVLRELFPDGWTEWFLEHSRRCRGCQPVMDALKRPHPNPVPKIKRRARREKNSSPRKKPVARSRKAKSGIMGRMPPAARRGSRQSKKAQQTKLAPSSITVAMPSPPPTISPSLSASKQLEEEPAGPAGESIQASYHPHPRQSSETELFQTLHSRTSAKRPPFGVFEGSSEAQTEAHSPASPYRASIPRPPWEAQMFEIRESPLDTRPRTSNQYSEGFSWSRSPISDVQDRASSIAYGYNDASHAPGDRSYVDSMESGSAQSALQTDDHEWTPSLRQGYRRLRRDHGRPELARMSDWGYDGVSRENSHTKGPFRTSHHPSPRIENSGGHCRSESASSSYSSRSPTSEIDSLLPASPGEYCSITPPPARILSEACRSKDWFETVLVERSRKEERPSPYARPLNNIRPQAPAAVARVKLPSFRETFAHVPLDSTHPRGS